MHLGLGDQALGLLDHRGGCAGNRLRVAAQRLDVAPGEADAAVGQHVHRPGKRAVGVGEELIGERIIGRIGIQPLVYQKLSDTVVQAACGLGTACHPNGLGRDHLRQFLIRKLVLTMPSRNTALSRRLGPNC